MNEQELKVQHKQEVQHRGETTKPEKYFIPAVDIYETEEDVTVIAEMPGVGAAGVDVTLEDDVLTIRGRKEEEDQPQARVLLQEYEIGNFQRRFTVAETIDQNNIKASMNNGMLKVVLPKAAPAKPRKIEVKVE
jgi:HSP20 family protein